MRVHAWGADNHKKAVWFFIAEGYVVRYVVRPKPHVIDIQGPMIRSMAEALVLAWTSEVEAAGLRVGWAFYTAEIDEEAFVAALDAVKEWANAEPLDDVLYALFDGETIEIAKPRNS